MSEKRKRLDLSEIRLELEAERENIVVRRASRGEQIALRAAHEIADGKYFLSGKEIVVWFTVWERDIWQYDSDMLRSVLQANGLMPSSEHVYASDSINWNATWFGLAVRFTMRLELYQESMSSENHIPPEASDDWLNRIAP